MRFLFFGQFSDRMREGGADFMYPILLMLLICIGLSIYAFLKIEKVKKLKEIISHVSLFALVYGFLGMMIGLIGAFDAISVANDFSSSVLAAGLKIGLLSPTFGMFTFLIARVGIIALTIKAKNENA
ncbi:MotA/TolQ/ExbB proton channel family protein [uncultured Tenacibaculum sp.]|uniref:MotA/TolQ/ExbB proton channel family protein n=1 Tax=uncultured Tenacibaculum sp. TaxID=174713 RepID=UPI00260E8163|nr:MotA/TolQ/ExbB proton channel family protein [uncultured Tenacibaculum sp.]